MSLSSLEIWILIIVIIFTFVGMVGTIVFLVFTRNGKNLVTKIIRNKKYVICNLTNPNTDFIEKWYIVPRPDFYTKVGKYHYNLKPEYATSRENGRLVFNLDKNDAIPLYPNRTGSNEEIIQQVIELETAIDNNVKEFLYKRKDSIVLIIVGVGWLLTLIALIYAIYTIQSTNGTMKALMQSNDALKETINLLLNR